MTALDIGVVVIVTFFLARGLWTGFVRQLAFLLALSLGYLAAGTYYPVWSRYLSSVANPQLRFVLTYALLFFTTYVLVMLLGMVGKRVMQISFLGWFDRLLGGVFGLAKAVFLATMIFMALTGVFSANCVFLEKAFFGPYLTISSRWLTSIVRDQNLQAELLAKKPALSNLLSAPVPALQSLRRDAK